MIVEEPFSILPLEKVRRSCRPSVRAQRGRAATRAAAVEHPGTAAPPWSSALRAQDASANAHSNQINQLLPPFPPFPPSPAL